MPNTDRKTAEEIYRGYFGNAKDYDTINHMSNVIACMKEYASQPSPQESGRETVYRKVSVKERLPKKRGEYFTNAGSCHWTGFHFMVSGVNVDWWLEEIPTPVSEEVTELPIEPTDVEVLTQLHHHLDICGHNINSNLKERLRELIKRGLSTLRSTIESGKGIDKEELLKSIFMAGRRSIISSKSPDGSVEWEDYRRDNLPSPQEQDGQVAVCPNVCHQLITKEYYNEKGNKCYQCGKPY